LFFFLALLSPVLSWFSPVLSFMRRRSWPFFSFRLVFFSPPGSPPPPIFPRSPREAQVAPLSSGSNFGSVQFFDPCLGFFFRFFLRFPSVDLAPPIPHPCLRVFVQLRPPASLKYPFFLRFSPKRYLASFFFPVSPGLFPTRILVTSLPSPRTPPHLRPRYFLVFCVFC